MKFIIACLFSLFPILGISQNKQSATDMLWESIFTEKQVRSPYLPAAFDTAYEYDDSKVFSKALADLQEKARKRQAGLESLWKNTSDDSSAKYQLLQYIFEEKPQSFLDQHFKGFSDELKYETARLLISECNFNKGLKILLDLNKNLEAKSPLKLKVLSFLKEYSFYESKLNEHTSLTFHDLKEFKNSKKEELEMPPVIQPETEIKHWKLTHSDENQDLPNPVTFLESEKSENTLYLFQGDYGAYLLEENAGKFWLPKQNQQITLHSLYKGEVTFQLFEVNDSEVFESLEQEDFKKMKAVKEWHDKSSSAKDNHSGKFTETKVQLPPLEEGMYILTAKIKFCPFILLKRIAVSKNIIYANKNPSSLDLIVLNRTTLKPLVNESIKISDKDETTSLIKKTDDNGQISVDDIFKVNKLYISSVNHPILLRTYVENYQHRLNTIAAVWTSAPLYKPGELVQFRGNLRKTGLEHSLNPDEQTVQVEVLDKEKKTVWSGSMVLSKLGSFHAEFKLSTAAKTGKYTFKIARHDLKGFEVKAYRLPRFKFELKNTASFHEYDTNYENTITLRHMNGTPIAGEKIKVSINDHTNKIDLPYTTDKNGQVSVDIDKKLLAKNRINIISYEFRSPDGHINSEKHEISYFENPLMLSLHAEHFLNETIYSTRLIFNAIDFVKAEHIRYKLLDAEGKTIKTVDSFDGEIIIDKSLEVKTFECSATYKGYSVTVREEHRHEIKPINKILSIRCKKTANNLETVNLNINWNPKSKSSIKAYLFGQNLKTSFRKVITLQAGINSIPVKIDRKWGPNIFFNIYAFTPESDKSYLEDSCSVKIITDDKIKVSVATDKKVYKPGEECLVTLSCSDMEGRPLPYSEISLSVLNESLFLNGSAKPLAPVFNQYSIADMHNNSFGGTHSYHLTKKWHLGAVLTEAEIFNSLFFRTYSCYCSSLAGKRNFFGGIVTHNKPRIKFNEIAVWKPLLICDEEGKVSVSFKLPDTVTNWIFDVKAVSPNGFAAEKIESAVTDLKIETDFILPRIVRAGDKIGMPIQIINRSEKTAAVFSTQIRHEGKFLRLVKEKHIKLEGNSVTGKFLFTEIPLKGQLEYKSSIQAHGESDSVVRNLPISPGGYLNTDYRYIGKNKEENFLLPSDGIFPHTIKVEAQLESSLQTKVLNAMKTLKNYRYGCAEQTISRFTPLIVVNESLKKIGAKNPYESEMPKIISEGLARLYRFQHPDGGWLWYEHGESSYRVSTLVLEGLLEAYDQGIRVDEDTIHRGADYVLTQFINNLNATDKDSTIGSGDRTGYHALTALSRYAYLFSKEELKKEIEKRIEGLNKDAKHGLESLNICKTLLYLKKEKDALKLFKEIIAKPQSFKNREDVVLAGTKLELAAVLTPEKNFDEYISSLMNQRKNGWWYDTRATHLVVRGLSKHIDSQKDIYAVDVYLNSKQIGQLNSKTLKLNLQGSHLKGAKLTFKNYTGNLYNAFVHVESFGIKKLLYKNPHAIVTGTFRELNSQAPLNSQKSLLLDRNKYYTYEIHFKTQTDLKYSRLTIPRPAGIEILDKPKLKEGIVSFEEYDDSFNFFIEKLPAGTHSLTLNFRADLPGEIFAPLPELDSMYGDPLKVNSYAPEKWIIK